VVLVSPALLHQLLTQLLLLLSQHLALAGFDDGFVAGLHAASSSGLLPNPVSQPPELLSMPIPGMPLDVQLAEQQLGIACAAYTAATSAAALAAHQQLPYDGNAAATAAFHAYEAQGPHPMAAEDSSSMLQSSVLLQQLLLEQQHQQQMQQQAFSQPLPTCRGPSSSLTRLSMPLSSSNTVMQSGGSPFMQQQQQQSYDALLLQQQQQSYNAFQQQQQQQQQRPQMHGKTHSSDSVDSCSSSTSGMPGGGSKSTKPAAAASLTGGCGAEQLLDALVTLNQELHQLQQLRSQLAAAAAAAQGTPIAAACQAATQLHQDTVHQALAVKAAMEVSMAVQASATAVQGAAAAAAAGFSEQGFGQSQGFAAAGGGVTGEGPGPPSYDDGSMQMSCTVGSTV
jgi:hypothetical protein